MVCKLSPFWERAREISQLFWCCIFVINKGNPSSETLLFIKICCSCSLKKHFWYFFPIYNLILKQSLFLFHILSHVSVLREIDFEYNTVKFDWGTCFSSHDFWYCSNPRYVLNVLLHLLHIDFCVELLGETSLCWFGWLCDNGRIWFILRPWYVSWVHSE